MELGEESRMLTTFYTHEGLFRFKRLVQGAVPASQEFHEKFRLSLHGLKGVKYKMTFLYMVSQMQIIWPIYMDFLIDF